MIADNNKLKSLGMPATDLIENP